MSEEQGDVPPSSPDIHFEPIVKLPLVEVKTLEENEDTLFKIRAKLFRYDSTADPPEWKERGTGDVKILKHKLNEYVRILMRRDKTLKICANHYILPHMELKTNSSSDRAWIWSTLSDFADEEPKPELLAIKFANSENAQKFKEAFNQARELAAKAFAVQRENSSFSSSEENADKSDDEVDREDECLNKETSDTNENNSKEVTEKLSTLAVKDESHDPEGSENKDQKEG